MKNLKKHLGIISYFKVKDTDTHETSPLIVMIPKDYMESSILNINDLHIGQSLKVIIIGSRVKFEEFKEADFCFKSKKEAALLENLLSSLSELNLGNFREAISDHARITPLDSWHMNLFQKIEKENLKNDILKEVNQEQKEEQEGSGDLGDNIFA